MDFLLAEIFEPGKFFGVKYLDVDDFFELLVRLVFNTLICIWLVRYIYYPIARKKEYLFTYLLFSVVVFLVCHLLSNVKLELGFALGLFALFGIIRYRTAPLPIKEMTYLFIIIGISVVNGLANKKVSYAELIFTNLIVVLFTYGLEKLWLKKPEKSKLVNYEKVDLIHPERHHELIQDLRDRTGLEIHRISVGRIDYLRDMCQIRIFFYDANHDFIDYDEDSQGQI